MNRDWEHGLKMSRAAPSELALSTYFLLLLFLFIIIKQERLNAVHKVLWQSSDKKGTYTETKNQNIRESLGKM